MVALALALLASGCRLIEREPAGRSPLARAAPSAKSVALEIFFARLPPEARAADGMWTEIDEQQIDPETRRRLAENGLRAGVVGAHLPRELAEVLKISDTPPADRERVPLSALEAEPAVTMRLLQTRAGRRNELVASPAFDEMPLLLREEGQVRGRTYRKAEGRFALGAFPVEGGRVRLELVPELHYGEPQQRVSVDDGVLRFEPGRPRKAFDDLRLKVSLWPGQMLIVTSPADRPGSLGHYFFRATQRDAVTSRLLAIRLAQAGPDQAFSPPAEKTIDLSIEN